MSQYLNRYAGQPAAVLGGGPSLPGDLADLPDGCVLIAVNYHAFHFCEPAFMVYNDHPASDDQLLKAVNEHRAVLVSPDHTSDVLFDVEVWTGFYSSNTATWFALWMGCDPVILCGMDCYQGDKMYCHPCDHDEPNFHYPLSHHLRPWVEEAQAKLPHAERLCAMSGPLAGLFGNYKERQYETCQIS